MQSLEAEPVCPACSRNLIDLNDELVCPACGIVKEKQVLYPRKSIEAGVNDYKRQGLGSYLGPIDAGSSDRNHFPMAEGGSTLRYLKSISDHIGRDPGPAHACAKMVERSAEKLSLPRVVVPEALLVTRKILASRRVGRRASLASISAFSLIIACKVVGVTSVSVNEIVESFRALGKTVKVSSIIKLTLESPVKSEPRGPQDYLSRVIARLSQDPRMARRLEAESVPTTQYFRALRELAMEILGRLDSELTAGRRPCALAATAIYAAELCLANKESRARRLSQRDLAESGDTAEYTIREQYREVFMRSSGLMPGAALSLPAPRGN